MLEYEYVKKFTLNCDNIIRCPECGNRVNFAYVGERIDYGTFSMKLACANRYCDWVSEEVLEDSGYEPDMGKDNIIGAIYSVKEQQVK